jgi:hypothetical protein
MSIQSFSQYLIENNSRHIKDLPANKERPMVEGVAAILKKVRDKENRQEIADAQIREFKRDGIQFDYAEFLELCGL